MVQYIKRVVKAIEEHTKISPFPGDKVLRLMMVLVEELDRLDPRDFLPDVQFGFVIARDHARALLRMRQRNRKEGRDLTHTETVYEPITREQADTIVREILPLLDKYGGEGWRAQTRSFSFIKDNELRQIIERDYKELVLVLFPGGAWKSTVIMAGSILEAILFDVLASDPTIQAKALASSVAPKGSMEDWRLEYLIKVAADIGVLPAKRAATFDQVLRDYRNFVHPKKEVKSGHPCQEGEAQLAIGGLNAMCDLLEGP